MSNIFYSSSIFVGHLCPTYVFQTASTAPNSNNSWNPSLIYRESGISKNGNAATSPSFNAAMRRMTAARLLWTISGSVNSVRLLKSSSENSRIHTPAETRPQRPLARVLNRQRGRDHQYFHHAVVLLHQVWSGGSGVWGCLKISNLINNAEMFF